MTTQLKHSVESNREKSSVDSTNNTSAPANRVVSHPISTSILTADTDLLKTYPHSKRVGNYLLGKTLGEGSFAKVKEALHALTTVKVSIGHNLLFLVFENVYQRSRLHIPSRTHYGIQFRVAFKLKEIHSVAIR